MKSRYLPIAAMGIILGLSALVMAQSVPQLINYQGRLVTSGGQPLDSNTVPMHFALLDGNTPGSHVLWGETQPSVKVSKGIYNVILGSVTPIPSSVVSGAVVYMEVKARGEVFAPRQQVTSVAFAMQAENAYLCVESDLLDGMDSLDFADAIHQHSGADINSGLISNDYFSASSDLAAEGLLDNNADSDLLTRLQADGRYVNTAGDDSMAGSLGVGGDLTVTGGNIGLGTAANTAMGITNDKTTAPNYGAYLYGSVEGLQAAWAGAPLTHYAILAKQTTGVETYSGTGSESGTQYGVYSTGTSLGMAYGVLGWGYGNGTGDAFGISGRGSNISSGAAYGGWFQADNFGTGSHYGVFTTATSVAGKSAFGIVGRASGPGTNYAGWFDGARVHIGTTGAETYVSGEGDLYVQHTLEVDGPAYFSGGLDAPNAIDSGDVSFNYAGSASKGGAANSALDLSCTDCVSAAEVQFNYAGSASEGGPASDLACTDCVSAAEVQFNYAGSATEGGVANDSDLLDNQHGSFYRDATNISTGSLGNAYFSAYSDLGAEGYLDNSAVGDLLTQSQGDGRFINTVGDDSMAGSLGVGGDLTVTGGNIGIGTAPDPATGIVNNSAGAPVLVQREMDNRRFI